MDTFPLPNVKLSDAEYASVQDRELLHHYGTVAFRSFVDYDIYKRVWEVDVPREAISQRFLMHLVLAISALHVNHLRSSARNTLPYREMANRHYECAVAKFSLSVPQMTPLNASAVFAFSYLSVFFAFGSSQFCASRGKLEDPITELLDIFILLRKAMMTLKQAWSLVEGSVMGILLQRGPQITDRRYLPVETAAAVELMEDHCLQLLTVGTVDPELVMLYREAISQLWDCLVMAHTRRKDWSMALRFPIVCSDGFLARLSQRDPVALILLAHFCVILHKAPVRWWAQGWGKQVICAVFNNLPDSSRCAVAWPMEMLELNQVPRSPSRGNGRQ